MKNNISSSSSFPAIYIALATLTSFAIISIGHLILNKPLLYLDTLGFAGFDYFDFFRASTHIVNGQSPYDFANTRYVTTPIPALLNIVLLPLGFDTSRNLLFILIPCSVALGYALMVSLYSFSKAERDHSLLAGLACLLFGFPFYFLLQRGNIDGWVLLFLCLGFLFSQKPKKEWLSGLCFSLAIAFKIYPVLILVPIILYKKWRLLLWIGLSLALGGVLSGFWFSDFQSALITRSQLIFRIDENGSLVATVILILTFLNALGVPTTASVLLIYYAPIIAAFVYGLLLSLVVFTDYKASGNNQYDIASFTMYMPFMVALPQLVYTYSFIICLLLVPTMSYLWGTHKDKSLRATNFFVSTGLVMMQWQAIATFNLTQNVLAHAIPGTGLLMIMIGISVYKILALRQISRASDS